MIIIFSCSLSCQCSCPHSEPIPAYPGRPQYFQVGLWTCCWYCGASSDSDLVLFDPKVHSLNCGNTCCLFRYSTDAGLPSRLRGFNPLLLQLQGEISLLLLCLHCPWGSALVLAQPLHVGHSQESVPCPGKRG